jgi:shikimate dehydrogenase
LLSRHAGIIAEMVGRLVPDPGVLPEHAIMVGLIGRGIQASRTPRMHEREGARLGIPYVYVLIDFDLLGLSDDALADVISQARTSGFAGLNVTYPFKQAIIDHLDALDTDAEAIGAVNTVVLSPAGTEGHNTDCWGFGESFRESMDDVPMRRVVQFGAGGAGAAVAHALMELGAGSLSIIDSDRERAARLADSMRRRFANRVHAETDVEATLALADGIVNTTPVGMTKHPGVPFAANLLEPRHWVAEIIYFPQETELLRRARALGCRTLPGAGMAIYQAVRAFELFTGKTPDRRTMAGYFETAA